uniref:glucuronosyltransferase n=1 Tax=Plectus sambesii TaxID=2011161 RepID=A0A914VAD3_9BILA
MFIAVLFAALISGVNCSKIAVIASSGCYSHDVLSKAMGSSFSEEDHEITWIQVRVFDFGQSVVIPQQWKKIIFDGRNVRTAEFVDNLKALLWTTAVPLSPNRLYDMRGVKALSDINTMQHETCWNALKAGHFDAFRNESYDLVIVDYLLQECGEAIGAFLNKSISVSVANYPFMSTYTSSMALPSNPSSVPETMTALPSSMNFVQRTQNTIVQGMFLGLRVLSIVVIDWIFWFHGVTVDVGKFESDQIFVGSPLQALIGTPRPIDNRFKYFGCSTCSAWRNSSATSPLTNIEHRGGFVLVSFGSITSANKMPKELIQQFMDTFASFNLTFLWQFGSTRSSVETPQNVVLFDWLPISSLLHDQRTKLFINHGGLSSVSEAIDASVPILGIPLQGDQPHNLQRLSELGVASMVQLTEIMTDQNALKTALSAMLSEHDLFKRRTRQLATMLNDYQQFAGSNIGQFWMNWALRNGEMITMKAGEYLKLQNGDDRGRPRRSPYGGSSIRIGRARISPCGTVAPREGVAYLDIYPSYMRPPRASAALPISVGDQRCRLGRQQLKMTTAVTDRPFTGGLAGLSRRPTPCIFDTLE